MESSHDSIKYVEANYTNAQRDGFDWDMENASFPMEDRFDDVSHKNDVMYESFESRYATELVNVAADKIEIADTTGETLTDGTKVSGNLTVTLKEDKNTSALKEYIYGGAVIYVVVDGVRKALAMQEPAHSTATQSAGRVGVWFGGKVELTSDVFIKAVNPVETDGVVKAQLVVCDANGVSVDASITGSIDNLTITGEKTVNATVGIAAVARYDSEKDLTGKHLGEVSITMRDYHFRPRPISLGVTWTQMTELVLDTSFGVSAEEMLLDYASQEIKKALDFQSLKYGSDVQKAYASDNFVTFNAMYASDPDKGTKDSYWHQAQLIGQAIGHVEDNMLNKFNRGGTTAIYGGPKACRYLELNEGWTNKGAQPKIGAHKVGELNGTPIFKCPAGVVADDELITTWKNPNAEGDVCIAIGTLVPFLSTGALQRKNLYKEAAIARYEDTQALRPEYLGRIKITNIQ